VTFKPKRCDTVVSIPPIKGRIYRDSCI